MTHFFCSMYANRLDNVVVSNVVDLLWSQLEIYVKAVAIESSAEKESGMTDSIMKKSMKTSSDEEEMVRSVIERNTITQTESDETKSAEDGTAPKEEENAKDNATQEENKGRALYNSACDSPKLYNNRV